MSAAVRLSALGVVLLGVSLGACASIVGADFGDVQGTSAAISEDGGHVIQPGVDSGPNPHDSGPIVVADADTCATFGLSACAADGGGSACVDFANDPDHCENCAMKCASDPNGRGSPACINGNCTFACPDGYELCATPETGCCVMGVTDDGGAKDTGGPDPGIPCANSTSGYCPTAQFGFCCGGSNSSGDVCGDENSPESLECAYAFYCGSAAECLSSICCYDDNDNSESDPNGKSSICQATCPNDAAHIQFCNPAKTGECLTGTCSGSNTFKGDNGELPTTYYFCQ